MRVVGVEAFTGPDALRVYELPERHAGPGEVRIAVVAAAINPTDTYVSTGGRAKALEAFDPPYVPGMDVAGVIDEIGPNTVTDHTANDLAVGDRVMAIVLPAGQHGGYSDSLVVPARSVAHAPRRSTHAEASTLPMNGLTARKALDMLALPTGATVAVTGAAGAFGGYTVQLAKADGLRVVADASEADETLVRQLGADEVVRRGDDVAARIRAVVPGGVDGLADGAVQNELVLPAVRDGGAVATVRPFAGEPERGITIHGVWVREYLLEHEKLDMLRQQVDDGAVTLRVAATYAPDDVAAAHRRLAAGGTRGRLVIQFRPDR